ncbi:MAG: hypothetical protein AB7O26_18455 [Planctomycetaceae bacterium]
MSVSTLGAIIEEYLAEIGIEPDPASEELATDDQDGVFCESLSAAG